MNKKLIVGISFIALFSIYGFFAFKENINPYMNFVEAKDAWGEVQIKGTWEKDLASNYDLNSHIFEFFLKDEKGTVKKVMFKGAKPNNFEHATSVVVKGKLDGDVFVSEKILVKCPSKYQSEQADGVGYIKS